jgi:hypothetical protein
MSIAGTRRTDPARSAGAMEKGGGQVVSVLANMARAHAIAAVIEDAAGQQGLGVHPCGPMIGRQQNHLENKWILSTAHVAMSASKPSLLNVTLWLSPFCNGPKRWNEWTAMFVYSNCVQSYFDMLAEACVMKTERDKCEISGDRSETDSG